MSTTRTFEHDNKKYEISYDRKTGNCIHKFDFELEKPFTAETQVSKPTHEEQEKLMFDEEQNGFDGIGVKKEAIVWMREVAEKKEQETTENTEEVEVSQELEKEEGKEEKDETVCSAKGCRKRKDREDTYCQFHQELKAEAQNTDRDATPSHPTGGGY